MDSLLHTRNKKIISWVDSSWWKPSKVTKNSTVGWKGYGNRILGSIRNIKINKTLGIFCLSTILRKVKPLTATITWPYCIDWAQKKKKRFHMQNKKVLFHQDIAPCHKSMKTMVKLNELSFELFPYPPYSPHLAPSDYWLFAYLKKGSKERDLAPMKK